jgi:hypothetical protein
MMPVHAAIAMRTEHSAGRSGPESCTSQHAHAEEEEGMGTAIRRSVERSRALSGKASRTLWHHTEGIRSECHQGSKISISVRRHS